MRKSLFSREYDTLVAMLREVRQEQGVTQIALAKRLRTTQSFISKCERGERRLDILELRQWCAALEVGFVDFVQTVDKRLRRR